MLRTLLLSLLIAGTPAQAGLPALPRRNCVIRCNNGRRRNH
jgi:hypothetical protein